MRVRGPWRPRGGAGGRAGGRQWPRVPHIVGSMGGCAGGKCDAQVVLRGAHVQGRRRAR